MRSSRFRLFFKVSLLMVGLATVPLTLVGLHILLLNQESLQTEVLRYHTLQAESLAEKLSSQLGAIEETLRFAVNSLQAEKLGWPEKQSILQSLVDSNPSFAIIAVVSRTGEEQVKVYNPGLEPTLAAFPTLVSHKDSALFQAFLTSKGHVLEVTGEPHHPRLLLYFPFDSPTGRHAIFIKNSLEGFWSEIGRTKIGPSGYAFLTDRNGRLLAHPDPAKVEEKASMRALPIVTQALAGNVGASEFSHEATMWVGAAAPIRRLGGAVVTLQPRDEAFEASRKSRRTAMGWIALSALLAAVLAYLFARQLTRPIFSLTQAAKDVHLESGAFPQPVVVKTGDELQELAETFNAMTQQLHSYTELQVERLLTEKTKTEAIVFSIDDGLIMINHEGLIEFINHRARQILDITVEYQSLLKKPLWDFIPHSDVMDVLWDIAHNPQRGEARELDLSSTGYRRVFSVTSEVVRTARGDDIGIVITLHDVTLEKEIEQMKDDFLHSITHDLRNPMASIRGFLKFLLDGMGGPVTDQQRKMLETMDRASLRLLGMINDILDVAKLESGKMELNLAETDLRDTAKHVLELMQAQAAKKKIDLIVDAPADLPAVAVDPLLVERLFTNLVGNAIKFTPEGGRITVELRDEPGRVYGAVVDTGEGIHPDHVGRVFEKFQQVPGQRKGGTGLGLTICKFIVESHKGNIGLESEVGKGSRFFFTLSKGLVKTPSGEVAVESGTSIPT
jgi:PAS domain S-box-containing protein